MFLLMPVNLAKVGLCNSDNCNGGSMDELINNCEEYDPKPDKVFWKVVFIVF